MNKLLASFTNEPGGFSARKLTAFALMVCIAYVHARFINSTNAIDAITVDVCGVLICLGIVTAENIIAFKNGTSFTKETTTEKTEIHGTESNQENSDR